MTQYEKAMNQINEWIRTAEEDGDNALARNLKHARDVLGGYSKLSAPTSAHNAQVMAQYNNLVKMAMYRSNNSK